MGLFINTSPLRIMKAIIIDDEQKGREILQKLINDYCTDVEAVAIASNVKEAYELIIHHKPDLVFLDIEMPGGNGFSLLDKFQEIDFKVIITTAFDEYAITAIKHRAFDYLLKPIDIDELRVAVDSVKKTIGNEVEVNHQDSLSLKKLSLNSRLSLPVKDGIFYLTVSEIMRIESDGGYSTFHTCDGKKYVVSRNLKGYEDILPEREFFRVHKSHLINIKKVKKYIRTDGNFIEMEDGSIVEIARRKKDEFLQLMNSGN